MPSASNSNCVPIALQAPLKNPDTVVEKSNRSFGDFAACPGFLLQPEAAALERRHPDCMHDYFQRRVRAIFPDQMGADPAVLIQQNGQTLAVSTMHRLHFRMITLVERTILRQALAHNVVFPLHGDEFQA